MAQSADEPNPCQRVFAIDSLTRTPDTHDSVKLEQRDSGGWSREADSSVLNAGYGRRRKSLRIQLQPNFQCGRWVHSANHFIHAKGIGPFRFVAEGVVSKCLHALRDQRWV
jgi:hypothetical protein